MKKLSLVLMGGMLVAPFLGWDLIGTSKNWHFFFLLLASSASWHITQEKLVKRFCAKANDPNNDDDAAPAFDNLIALTVATGTSFATTWFTELCIQAWYTHAEMQEIPQMDNVAFVAIIFFTLLLAFGVGPTVFMEKRKYFGVRKVSGIISLIFKHGKQGY